ncbi:hypothetical protein NQZ79_g4438 [Umbelopsis isabellina]|nr:hypothetical protein NQZ79_g4438 [Umbelopsis isabellina]
MTTTAMALANLSFEDILDDLSSRFVINVPEEELASVERICFQIEQAHWFYEDFVREQKPELPSFSLKNFSAKIFQHCPLLRQWENEHERAFADFMQYKIRIPGWSSKSGWGFPKGKINKDEENDICAAREVLEETGFDITPYIEPQNFLETTLREQRIRLYIICGVPENSEFIPRTRKEISQIAWFKLTELPTYKVEKKTANGVKSDSEASRHKGVSPNKVNGNRFYMVVPFVRYGKIARSNFAKRDFLYSY